ncbi:CUB and sushi domain-containing protein 3-like [Daphnia carinata]|uniref:CUB and sushi domain-containing protein 3-like n=1 Tax=Daphnia carinata TaxID=120202 RepID=UPI00257FD1FF|nr:CUB and sushi domain-containing protein 3-like [Daphnia carinata]
MVLFLPLFFKLVIICEVILYLILGAKFFVSKALLAKKEKITDFIRGTTSTTPQAITTNAVTIIPTTETAMTTAALVCLDAPTCTNSCGVCTDVTSTGGTIQSRNFPDDYDGYGNGFGPLDCIFAIKVCPGKKIQLTFTQFVVESCCDTVTVFDGTSTDGTLLPPTSGYTIPSSSITTSNKMTVTFNSDGNNNALFPQSLRPGKWQATFTVV